MDESDREETAPLIRKHGIPTPVRDTRQSYEKQLAVYFILASTLFERIAFYSLESNVKLFFPSNSSTSSWDPRHNSTALLFTFAGISYISTLIFAILSDAKLRRARTIIIGLALYIIGYALLTTVAYGDTILCQFKTTSIPMENSQCAPWILGSLICTAIGAGAVKANLTVFGAEQIQQSRITSRYFDKYVVAANIGFMIATLITPFIPNNGKYHYFLPYIVADSMLFVAVLLFLIGWRYYIHVKAYETVVVNCIPVVANAFRSWRKYKQNERAIKKETAKFAKSPFLNVSQSISDEDRSTRVDERPSTFLDFAKVPNGKFHDRIVDDVKSLRKALVVFTLLIPYWLVYNQTSTTFQYQGTYMKPVKKPDYLVPWMSLGDPITIILGILISNMCVYKYLDVRNQSSTIIGKFVIGMCFAFLSMCIAGAVEFWRQHGCNDGSEYSDVLIYAQLPQNIFMGFSQLFAMVASYEYAYFAAPLSAQSLFMSLHFCSAGISSFIDAAYSNLFLGLATDPDFSCPAKKREHWIFYTYYFSLAGLQLIFIVIFIVCQKKFRIIKMNPQQIETN